MTVVKMHRRGAELLVAAADDDLLGRTFKSDGLTITVSESFYKGESCDEEGLVNRLRMATMANLVGEQVVALAIKHGLIDPESVLRIGGVPHAQMVRMV
jgi:hypothetical protein